MNTYYEIDGINKIATEDNYEEGCKVGGSQDNYLDHRIRADTLEELINRFCAFVDVEREDIQIREDQGNRIDAQRQETIEGFALTSTEFEQFKHGTLKAWLCDYSASVYQIKKSAVDLTKEI